jgi:hypothetical protein
MRVIWNVGLCVISLSNKTGGELFLNDLAERVYVPDKIATENTCKWSRRSTVFGINRCSKLPAFPLSILFSVLFLSFSSFGFFKRRKKREKRKENKNATNEVKKHKVKSIHITHYRKEKKNEQICSSG